MLDRFYTTGDEPPELLSGRIGGCAEFHPLHTRELLKHSLLNENDPLLGPLLVALHEENTLEGFARVYWQIIGSIQMQRRQDRNSMNAEQEWLLIANISGEPDSYICCANGSVDKRFLAERLKNNQTQYPLPNQHFVTSKEQLIDWLQIWAEIDERVADLYILIGGVGNRKVKQEALAEEDRRFIERELDRIKQSTQALISRMDLSCLPAEVVSEINRHMKTLEKDYRGAKKCKKDIDIMRTLCKMAATIGAISCKTEYAIFRGEIGIVNTIDKIAAQEKSTRESRSVLRRFLDLF